MNYPPSERRVGYNCGAGLLIPALFWEKKYMGRSVNMVILMGHLGKDAETKFTPGGVSLSSFSLATNRRVKDKEDGQYKDVADWHNIVLWRSENVANYLKKGALVHVKGRLESRSWEAADGSKRYAVEVVAEANDLLLVGGKDEGAAPLRSQPRAAAPAAPADPLEISEDDILPF